ncbi:hypothetical protein PIB30_059128 [Stylosanthes scabra]|uniref:Uncharacterized protein n=1 Tax=Stylosanthes scabra TaxID=79078 RepID=A0ABU6TJY4_9FABA|nr:hypothetical protein [Stylosanthes scabra]
MSQIYRRLDQQQEENRKSFEAINTRMDRMDDQLSFLCYSSQMGNETMYYPYQNTARQFREMEAQGIPVTIANLAIHRHREEEMNRERMRHNQTVQEAASQRAREANKGKAREVVPDSEEWDSIAWSFIPRGNDIHLTVVLLERYGALAVYVHHFVVYNLEPLEMAAFKFLVSLPSGLPKRSKFTCRFILDGSDAKVGKLLDDLLDVKMKRSKLDDLMAKMADPARMGPRPILPTGRLSAIAAAAAAASTTAGTSTPVAVGSSREEISIQVPPAPAASEAKKAKKQLKKREQTMVVDLEDELKEDPAADLQRQRRRKKPKFDKAFEKALGDDAAWEHKVDPLRVAFPEDFDYQKALNAGLTSAPIREALTKIPPKQLLGESYHLHAKSLAYLHVGVETSLAAKIKAEKKLSAALDQIEVLKGERDSALSFLPFKEKATTLEDKLSEKLLEYQSALDRIAQLEEDHKVLKAQFESSQLSLETERKRAAAAEGQVEALAASLKTCQADLRYPSIGARSGAHSDLRTIFVPQESEVEGELPSAEEIAPERDPVAAAQSSPPEAGDAAGGSGECPT